MASWLAVPPQAEIPRNELLLKIFFGSQLSPEIAIEYIEHMAESERKSLQLIKRAADEIAQNQQYPDAPYWKMAARFGEMELEAHQRWAEETLARIEEAFPQNAASTRRLARRRNMQANEVLASSNLEESERPRQIASWGWLLGFLLIGAGVVVMGFLAQNAPKGSGGTAAPSQFASHGQAIPIYLSLIAMDWALLYYCWAGVHRHGGNLKTLSGGRWTSWKSVATDVAIALPFWALWEGAAFGVHWLLDPRISGAGNAKSVASLLPRTPLEILIWIAVSITAGVCEELGFSRLSAAPVSCAQRKHRSRCARAGVGVWPVSRLSGLEERRRHQHAWSSVWHPRRLAQESARKHHRSRMVRYLGRLAADAGLAV